MLTIFVFSHQESDKSSETSGKTIRAILNIIPQIDKLQEEQKEEIISFLQPIARKLAHFFIYAIGGILIILLINEYKLSDSKKIVFSGTLGGMYAITDEIHQSFIPRQSRNGN